MPNLRIMPVRRVQGGRVYSAVLTLDGGKVAGLSAHISDEMWRCMRERAGELQAYLRQHVQLDAGGSALPMRRPDDAAGYCACAPVPDGPCGCYDDYDVAGAVFGGTVEALADGVSADAAPRYADLAWSYDDYAGAEERLYSDLASAWQDCAGADLRALMRPIAVSPRTGAAQADILHRAAIACGYV